MLTEFAVPKDTKGSVIVGELRAFLLGHSTMTAINNKENIYNSNLFNYII